MNATREQLERLKARFPGEYVTIQAEIHHHSDGSEKSEFKAYAQSQTASVDGRSVKDAVDNLIAKADGTAPKTDDAAAVIDQMEGAAQ